jgi:hypothetical protein
MFKNKKTPHTAPGLTDLDESVLFLTRPYAVITLICWILSLFCIINTRNDIKSFPFAICVITFLIDSFFLIILYFKAKNVRRKTKDGEQELPC